MAPRSRTGCLTCRHRKLKCDEQRPLCGQCIKAKRECIPSTGVTFRHQQNPSMNGGVVGRGGLESFYGYKETFRRGTTWVNVPKDLTFVHTSNPYEDEENDAVRASAYGSVGPDTSMSSSGAGRFEDSAVYSGLVQAAQAAYPSYATHGLEALSAVASQDQYSYAPPPSTMGPHDPHGSPPQHADSIFAQQSASSVPAAHIEILLNHRNAAPEDVPPANIDPRLHVEHVQAAEQASRSEQDGVTPTQHPVGPSSLEDELRLRIQG